ncbi:hypothetical protein [Paracraurococcus lichenis]|uniref:Sel1 repeat family protein n=1 Tax=Paracraurococcus lichenis TaxID=3064888 RepID=A0ABT9DUV1_9PROT|nr:hypothetical protein [Paracraurococcus sp. LOR1-02]MDO9707677.1 hypothetical protein [Paracraurococcus sp. LOR1-02]
MLSKAWFEEPGLPPVLIDIVLLHAGRGIALLQSPPNWLDDTPARLLRRLEHARFAAIFPGHLPVVHIQLLRGALAELPRVLDAAFAAGPPLDLPGGDAWMQAVMRALNNPAESLVEERAPGRSLAMAAGGAGLMLAAALGGAMLVWRPAPPAGALTGAEPAQAMPAQSAIPPHDLAIPALLRLAVGVTTPAEDAVPADPALGAPATEAELTALLRSLPATALPETAEIVPPLPRQVLAAAIEAPDPPPVVAAPLPDPPAADAAERVPAGPPGTVPTAAEPPRDRLTVRAPPSDGAALRAFAGPASVAPPRGVVALPAPPTAGDAALRSLIARPPPAAPPRGVVALPLPPAAGGADLRSPVAGPSSIAPPPEPPRPIAAAPEPPPRDAAAPAPTPPAPAAPQDAFAAEAAPAADLPQVPAAPMPPLVPERDPAAPAGGAAAAAEPPAKTAPVDGPGQPVVAAPLHPAGRSPAEPATETTPPRETIAAPASQEADAAPQPPRDPAPPADLAPRLPAARPADPPGTRGIAAVPPPAAAPPAQTAPRPAARGTDPALVTALLRRGEALLALGDVSGARRFFERAADAGSAEGARAAGGTYDPAALATLGVRGIRPDPEAAAAWYRRADTLAAEARR